MCPIINSSFLIGNLRRKAVVDLWLAITNISGEHWHTHRQCFLIIESLLLRYHLLAKPVDSVDGNFMHNCTLSEKSNFVHKFNFDRTPTFSRVFHPKFFWQFFSWNQSCQQLKSPKRVFHPKKSTIFSGNQSWIFGQKMKISNSVFT